MLAIFLLFFILALLISFLLIQLMIGWMIYRVKLKPIGYICMICMALLLRFSLNTAEKAYEKSNMEEQHGAVFIHRPAARMPFIMAR